MISIFTAPKPFIDPHIATIQRNAIRSWKGIGADVTLVGDEEGIAEAAAELSVKHAPDVARNEYGTPKIDSIFALGRSLADYDLLAYVNADIILLPDLNAAAKRVTRTQTKFLIIGQRWDLDIRDDLDFSGDWVARMQEEIKTRARRHPRGGSDYFLFPKNVFEYIPPFAIGRAGWDNWMIYEARQKGWKVVDGSDAVTIIHQDHDYSHLPGGKPHYKLPETFDNIKAGGGKRTIFILDDCNYILKKGELDYYPMSWRKFWREVEILPIVRWHSKFLTEVFFAIFHPKKAYAEWRSRNAAKAD